MIDIVQFVFRVLASIMVINFFWDIGYFRLVHDFLDPYVAPFITNLCLFFLFIFLVLHILGDMLAETGEEKGSKEDHNENDFDELYASAEGEEGGSSTSFRERKKTQNEYSKLDHESAYRFEDKDDDSKYDYTHSDYDNSSSWDSDYDDC